MAESTRNSNLGTISKYSIKWSSVKELEENFKLPLFVVVPRNGTKTGLAGRIYLEAEKQLSLGNEEFAYGFYFHFLRLTKNQRNGERINGCIQIQIQFSRALERMTILKDSLHRRYSLARKQNPVSSSQEELQKSFEAANEVLKMTKHTNNVMEELLSMTTALSISKKEDKNKAIQEPPDEVNCPICLELYQSEIFLCKNGHSVCASCSSKLRLCPECRVSYDGNGGRVRNRALEKLAQIYRELKDKQKGAIKVTLTREELNDLKLDLDDELVTIPSKLEGAYQKMMDTHEAWKRTSLEETQRLQFARGGVYTGGRRVRKWGWESPLQQATFWDKVVQSSKLEYK